MGYDAELKEQVIAMIREGYANSGTIIGGETRILHDLKIWGADAHELLSKLHDKYAVDFNRIDFDSYFLSEGYPPFLDRAIKSKRPITIGHLVDVCKRQQWFDPPPP